MKVLKIILSVIAALVAVFFIAGLFMPKSYEVEKTIIINAPDSVVWAQISDFKSRPAWDPWLTLDPTASYKVSEPSSGVGAGYTWFDGKEIGTGSITVLALDPYRSIKSKLAFKEPQMGESDVWWYMETTEEGVKLTWRNRGELSYPMERFFAGMIESMVGESFENGLINIKNICEK